MFQVFVICNTIAMYSAITVVALIWAQLDDLNLVIATLKFTVPIFGLALTMVCVGFMAGNYLVLRNLNWLAYLVLIIGTFFLLTLSMLFFPLCLPSSTHHVIPRCILYYPFLLWIKVTRSDIDDREEKQKIIISSMQRRSQTKKYLKEPNLILINLYIILFYYYSAVRGCGISKKVKGSHAPPSMYVVCRICHCYTARYI